MNRLYCRAIRWLVILGLAGSGLATRSQEKVSAPVEFSGMSDASGAVALDNHLFVVADDETNPLRIYDRDHPGPPVRVVDLSRFLGLDPHKPEMDLEAATRVGDRIYWMASHGRNRRAQDRPNRRDFFATDVKTVAGRLELIPVGRSYRNLLDDLVGAPQLARFHLAADARKAPKAMNALNIEGLSGTPGQALLIGFRNPIPHGRALLVPLLNPNEVIEQSQPARFGDPILLDLDGLGIRDIAYWDGTYVIIAGPYDGHARFQLYRWVGGTARPKFIKHASFKGLTPEAIIVYPDKGLEEIQILSDDGTREINGIPFKNLPVIQRRFRSVWVTP
jgi:hypothetical protein